MTATQLATLHFVVLRIDHGLPPTLQEIADRFGVAKISARDRLVSLRRHGWITWDRHQWRSLQVTASGRQHVQLVAKTNGPTASAEKEREAWTHVLRTRALGLRSQAEEYSAVGLEEWADGCRRTAGVLDELIETMCRGREIVADRHPDSSERTDANPRVPGLAKESCVKDDAAQHAIASTGRWEHHGLGSV